MPCLLHIETSTTVCSVALSLNGAVVFEKSSFEGPSHAALLGVYVDEAIKIAKSQQINLDAVAISSGPGSYTGLRIGVSLAKGLCYGYTIPLIAIPTLDILASTAIKQVEDNSAFYCVMLDARRMEVYAAIYKADLQQIRETSADIVTVDTYSSYLEKNKVYFFGNGAAKCKDVIDSPNAQFIEDMVPLATQMIPLAEKAFEMKKFEDVAYFEPFYLKEFQATVAKNKVLG